MYNSLAEEFKDWVQSQRMPLNVLIKRWTDTHLITSSHIYQATGEHWIYFADGSKVSLELKTAVYVPSGKVVS